MVQEKQMDLRVRKTLESIKNTFKEMVCEMDVEKITVKELTARASIHRKTFYLHYTCIEDLLEDMLQDAAKKYFEEIDKVPLPMPMVDVNRTFFNYLTSQDTFTERLICAPSYRDFCNKLFFRTLNHNRNRYNPYAHLPQEEQNIINTFVAEGSLNIYRQWVADGKKIPLERLIELSGTLLSSAVEPIVKNS